MSIIIKDNTIAVISVNAEIRKIDKESRKKMISFKKKYNRMFDKYHKELKEILFELDKKWKQIKQVKAAGSGLFLHI